MPETEVVPPGENARAHSSQSGAVPERARSLRVMAYSATAMAVVLASRLPLFGNREGEPDCGLFVEGLWRWLSYGPRVAEIYGKDLSPLYYWGLAALVRWRHVAPARFPLAMNVCSLAAALLTAPLLFLLARRWLTDAMAFAATLWTVLSPSFWWLGIEPHPQGAAMACFLLSVYAFLRAWSMEPVDGLREFWRASRNPPGARPAEEPSWGWLTAAAAALLLALLLRADHILLLGAYPALLLMTVPPAPGKWRARCVRPLTCTAGMLAAAGLAFVPLRAWMLQQSFAATQTYSEHQTGGYIYYGLLQMLRSRSYIVKQLLPDAVAPGALVGVVALLAACLAARRYGAAWLRPWTILVLGWSLAGYVFWFLVLGNNIRHVAPLALPVVWAGCAALERLLPRPKALLLVAAVLLVDPFVIPASSNVVLYASANVPASARLLWRRQAEMQTLLARLDRQSARLPAAVAGLDPRRVRIPACFLGSYTTPYMISFFLMRQNRLDVPGAGPPGLRPVSMRVGPGWSDVFLGPASGAGVQRWIRFYEMYSEQEYRKLRPGCVAVASLEYDAAGLHRRYLGEEWRHVPFQSLWYPPRAAVAQTPPLKNKTASAKRP